jgi:hypothetical protein
VPTAHYRGYKEHEDRTTHLFRQAVAPEAYG